MPNNGTISLTLGSLTASAAGTKATPGTSAVTLPSLTLSGTGRTGISQSGSGAMTLASVTVAVAGHHTQASGAMTLQSIAISGKGHSGISGSGTGALVLGAVRTVITAQPPNFGIPNKVVCVTGHITSTGSAIFQFQGSPNLGVSWTITTGSGAITPLTPYTDSKGQAFAIYTAGGYIGNLTVGCSYVT